MLDFDPTLPQGADSLAASQAAWTGDEHGFYHAQLTGRVLYLYDTLYPHFAARDTEFELGTLDELFEEGSDVLWQGDDEWGQTIDAFWNDYSLACYYIYYDHPEMFWLLQNDGCDPWGEPEWVTDASGTPTGMRVYDIDYGMTEDEVAGTQAALDAAVAEALAAVPEDGTDYEQAWAVYQWLCKNVEYSPAVAELLELPNRDEVEQWDRPDDNAVSALVDHVAVCVGYSKAYQLLLVELGIPCAYVVGFAVDYTGSLGHAWNLVCLGGRMGYVDATWSDMHNAASWEDTNRYTGETYTIEYDIEYVAPHTSS